MVYSEEHGYAVILYFFPENTARLDNVCMEQLISMTANPASVAQSDARPTGDQEVADSIPPGPATFVEMDHEIFSSVILSFRWFKKDS